jgi:predicted RNase H-like nuclease (RuvC/YqgF family)
LLEFVVLAQHAAHVHELKGTIAGLQQQLRMMLNALNTKDEDIRGLTRQVEQLESTFKSLQREFEAEKKRASKVTSECERLEACVANQVWQILTMSCIDTHEYV